MAFWQFFSYVSVRKKRSENYYDGVIFTDRLIDGTDTELKLLSKFQSSYSLAWGLKMTKVKSFFKLVSYHVIYMYLYNTVCMYSVKSTGNYGGTELYTTTLYRTIDIHTYILCMYKYIHTYIE